MPPLRSMFGEPEPVVMNSTGSRIERKVAKREFIRMLFSEGSAVQPAFRIFSDLFPSIALELDRQKRVNDYKHVARLLQRKESEFMGKVLLNLRDQAPNIKLFTVHDSIHFLSGHRELVEGAFLGVRGDQHALPPRLEFDTPPVVRHPTGRRCEVCQADISSKRSDLGSAAVPVVSGPRGDRQAQIANLLSTWYRRHMKRQSLNASRRRQRVHRARLRFEHVVHKFKVPRCRPQYCDDQLLVPI